MAFRFFPAKFLQIFSLVLSRLKITIQDIGKVEITFHRLNANVQNEIQNYNASDALSKLFKVFCNYCSFLPCNNSWVFTSRISFSKNHSNLFCCGWPQKRIYKLSKKNAVNKRKVRFMHRNANMFLWCRNQCVGLIFFIDGEKYYDSTIPQLIENSENFLMLPTFTWSPYINSSKREILEKIRLLICL